MKIKFNDKEKKILQFGNSLITVYYELEDDFPTIYKIEANTKDITDFVDFLEAHQRKDDIHRILAGEIGVMFLNKYSEL